MDVLCNGVGMVLFAVAHLAPLDFLRSQPVITPFVRGDQGAVHDQV